MNIWVEPIQKSIRMDQGQTLAEGLEQSGIIIEKPCGGLGNCGACRIWVETPGAVPPTPSDTISMEENKTGLRLACRAVPEKDCTVRLEESYVHEHRSRDHGRILSRNSHIRRTGARPAVRVIREGERFLLSCDKEDAPIALTQWHAGYRPKGLAIDIGTTTMVLSLVCLETGEELATATSLNPQVVFGHDVMTRIQHARTGAGLNDLTGAVREKLNHLIQETCDLSGSRQEEIVDVCIGANTTMLQLAAGMDPTPLGRAPFRHDIQGGRSYPADLFGLGLNAAVRVYIPPVVHAFVGTDISAGLTCCPGFFNRDRSVLFIDLGTNGEIALNAGGRWLTTSTAAGPAFEGMGLSTGMRAKDGAVERVDYADGRFAFHTIGGKTVRGICGSGIVDLLWALLESGSLDPSGRLLQGGAAAFRIVQMEGQLAFEYAQGFYLTQKDIRQIQLVKGAVRAGIDLILDAGGIPADRLDRICVAGGLGNYLNPASMAGIGLIPDGTAARLEFCGNTSLGGSFLLLTDGDLRAFLQAEAEKMTYLHLATSKKFMSCFLENLNFPGISGSTTSTAP
ncbi:MAG: ASKHA domain-containing protein [Pseudomonadota bacterium]